MSKQCVRLLLSAAIVFVVVGCGEDEGPTPKEKFGADIQSVRKMIFRDGTITRALNEYRMNAGSYPTTEQGLKALIRRPKGLSPDAWKGPYVDGPEAYTDMWGHELRYLYPSKVEPDKPSMYDLWSLGPDGVDNTDDDLLNHNYK